MLLAISYVALFACCRWREQVREVAIREEEMDGEKQREEGVVKGHRVVNEVGGQSVVSRGSGTAVEWF